MERSFSLNAMVCHTGLEVIGAVVGLAGAAVSAAGTIASGKQAQAAANYQADQQRRQGAEQRAAAQREAEDNRKKVGLLQSRQQAVAGASGFSATDETAMDLAGDTAERGAYQTALIQYGGISRQAGAKDAAAATRASGKAAADGAMWSAAGTLIGGAGSFFGKYASATTPGSFSPSTSGSGLWDADVWATT